MSHEYLVFIGFYQFLSLKSLNSGCTLIHKEVPCPITLKVVEASSTSCRFFSKEYGQGVHLAEGFLLACTNTIISVNDMTPMIRVALLATNLTCDKIVDGIGRLLLKSDVEKLKSKKLQPKVYEAEELLLGNGKIWKRIPS